MRRLLALIAAVGLVASFASSSIASTPSVPTTGFVGDFDVKVDGVKVGHISAVLLSVPDQDKLAGTYKFRGVNGVTGSALVGETDFYRDPIKKEVWFKALEIGYPGPGYGIFVGHFVDLLAPGATDYVEFWSQGLTYEPNDGGAFGSPWYGRWDVGSGTFALRVPAG